MTKSATEAAVVKKNIRVGIPATRAFLVFVEQMETWWPPEHHIGEEGFEAIFVEPKVGGRWYERDSKGRECDWGKVLAWDPPKKVAFSWHLGPDWKFDPDMARASEIEIRFTPDGTGTLVELEHSHIDRHGEGWEQLREMLEAPNAWAGTLAAYAAVADKGAER